jgi:hypothetical protein
MIEFNSIFKYYFLKEKFEDTKGVIRNINWVIRNRNSKGRQYNGQNKKDKQ